MRNILLLGAGRSSSTLIKYILENAKEQHWFLTLADCNLDLAKKKIKSAEAGKAVKLDVNDVEHRKTLISKSDIVISMLPARMHYNVVLDCITLKKNVITPSYVSDEIKELDAQAKEAGIIVLNEVGLDPGIDHMSAMEELNKIKNDGCEIEKFTSFTGGLVAPESDNNPWGYKFTWNPRNVVLAGQGGVAQFIESGKYKYIPTHQVFQRINRFEIDEYGVFEGYANRDSLKYRSIYNLEGIPTIYRGTLRKKGFCKAWNIFVQLGMTDDSYQLEDSNTMTFRSFLNYFLPYHPTDSVEIKLMHLLKIDIDNNIMEKLRWLELFKEIPVELDRATPAQILQKILQRKWSLEENDKDMVVMIHQFGYKKGDKRFLKESSMVCIGDDSQQTAMAKTVGLPVGIAAKLILNNQIQLKGVQLPIKKEVYQPILSELRDFGIEFSEKITNPNS